MDKDLLWFLIIWVGGGLLFATLILPLYGCSSTNSSAITAQQTPVKTVPDWVYVVPKIPERAK